MSGGWAFNLNRRPLLDVLCLLYGLSSWLAITGLWMELPLLVHALPERWALSAVLSLAIQMGNVGPLLYGLSTVIWRHRFTGPRALSIANHVQLCIGIIACVALITAWRATGFILGRETSIVLLVAAFALSIVDCTSSVVYLPFVGRFREVYMTSYLVGEGLGGVVPGLVALAQGVEDAICVNETMPSTSVRENSSEGMTAVLDVEAINFEPEVFFGVLLLLVLLSYGSFIILDNCKSFQNEWQEDFRKSVARRTTPAPELPETIPLGARSTMEPAKGPDNRFRITRRRYVILLLIQGWASLLTFGFLPAIQSYSCLPYGPRALHLAVTLCGIAYPVACVLGMFVTFRRTAQLYAQTLVGTLGATWIIFTAATSPSPPLVDTHVGSVSIVSCWVSTFLVLSYAKTMVTLRLTAGGERALFWVGASTQAGALVGSLVPYFLVSHLGVFAERDHCAL
ncbi:solute carrier family 52, riboflavin transporter, member 3-A-like [Haemaphysalis longicornis]